MFCCQSECDPDQAELDALTRAFNGISSPLSHQPRSSEAAVIQMEYDALDAREKGRKDAEEARRRRAAGEIKLAPASASLRLPSKG